jgi:hypothetical protein
MMARSSAQRVFTLLLAVLVTVGLTLSAALAGGMGMKMSMGTEMGASGHTDCHHCHVGAADKTKATTCAPVCAAPVIAMSSDVALLAVVEIATIALPEDDLLSGARLPPDPYPPRSAKIG